MEPAGEMKVYSYEELQSITGGFNAENFIGETLYGEVFRGEVQRGSETKEVIVKLWTVKSNSRLRTLDLQESRLRNEIKVLTESNIKWHPNLVKLIGYCSKFEQLGTVYELRSLDTVKNLIPQEGFKWMGRIKVAVGFARLLEFLQDQQIILRNIDSGHLMIDRAFNPRLLDFSMIVGGDFGEVPSPGENSTGIYESGCHGHIDPHYALTGDWSGADVFAYGSILLGLITKRMDTPRENKYVYAWATEEYEKLKRKRKHKRKSLVHKSLEMEPYFNADDGVEITKLALQCVHNSVKQRPTMKEVVSRLEELNVVQSFSYLMDMPLMEDYSSIVAQSFRHLQMEDGGGISILT